MFLYCPELHDWGVTKKPSTIIYFCLQFPKSNLDPKWPQLWLPIPGQDSDWQTLSIIVRMLHCQRLVTLNEIICHIQMFDVDFQCVLIDKYIIMETLFLFCQPRTIIMIYKELLLNLYCFIKLYGDNMLICISIRKNRWIKLCTFSS